jgi:hypothetical protein
MIGKISSGFINEKRSGYKNILSSGRRGRDGYGLLTRNGNFPPRIGTGAFELKKLGKKVETCQIIIVVSSYL